MKKSWTNKKDENKISKNSIKDSIAKPMNNNNKWET